MADSSNPNNPQKFSFDTDFFDVTVAGTVVPRTTARQDQMVTAAREEGYAAGLTEGRAQAAQAAAVEMAEVKNQLRQLTERLTSAQTSWQANLQKQCLSLLRVTLHHLIGHAAAHYPDQLFEHFLHDLLGMLRTQEDMTMHINPQARTYHEKLGLSQASISGRPFQIVPDPALGPAHIIIEWRTGGVEARLPELLTRIDQLLLSAGAVSLATPEAPVASGFTPPAPEQPAPPEPDPTPADLAQQQADYRANALLGDDEDLADALKPPAP